jgi:hypothetical protein
MTVNEAAVPREKWQGQTVLSEYRHFTLELEYNTSGYSLGMSIYILCGEYVARSI